MGFHVPTTVQSHRRPVRDVDNFENQMMNSAVAYLRCRRTLRALSYELLLLSHPYLSSVFFFVFFFLFPSETCFLLTFPVDYAGFSLQFGNTLLYHHARRESVYRAPVGLVVGIMADRCSDFVI